MTSPPEPSPAGDTAAALAVQVAALRGQVRLIFARLDKHLASPATSTSPTGSPNSPATVTQALDSPPRGPPPPTGSASTPPNTPHSSPNSGNGPTRSCAANTAATSSPPAGQTTRTPSGNCPPSPPNGTAPTAAHTQPGPGTGIPRPVAPRHHAPHRRHHPPVQPRMRRPARSPKAAHRLTPFGQQPSAAPGKDPRP